MKLGHYLYCFLPILLIKIVVSVPIHIVLIEDKDDSLPRMAIRKAIETNNDAKIDLKVVTIWNSTTANQLCGLIFKEEKNPTLVIDSIRKTYFEQNKLSDSLRLLLRNMGVPTISFSPNFSPWPGPPLTDVEKQFLIHIIPPELIMSQIVKSIVPLIEAKKTAILFETASFGVLKNKAGLIFDNIGFGIMMEEILGEATYPRVLDRLFTSSVTTIFVFASEEMVTKIISLASMPSAGFFNKEYAWFIVTKDETKLVCKGFQSSNGKVMLIKPSVVNNETINQVNSISIGNMFEKSFYYDFFLHLSTLLHKIVGVEEGWPETLAYSACGNSTAEGNRAEREKIKLRDHLEAMQASDTLKGTFGNFVIKNNENRIPFGRQDIRMKISTVTYKKNTSTIKDHLEWQYSELKKPAEQFIGKTDFIKNHQGALLIIVSTTHDPPFVYKFIRNEIVVFEGLCVDLLEMIRKEANFTFEFKIMETKHKKHGEIKPDGSFDGMIGDVVRGHADLVIGPLAVIPERQLVVDFIVPFYDLVGFSILMKRKKVEPEIFKFLMVLENDVWCCIVAAYFFTSPDSFYIKHEKHKKDKEDRDFSLKECLWFCLTSLTPQGGGEAPRDWPCRLLCALWWLFGFIIIASYTANLAAFLTISRLDYPIENLDDLVSQEKFKFSTVWGSLAYYYFQGMKLIEDHFIATWKIMALDEKLNETERAKLAAFDYPVSDYFTNIFESMSNTMFYTNFDRGISRTLSSTEKGGYAIIGESYQVHYVTLENCELRQVGPEFAKKPIAWAIEKGSRLNKPLSQVFLKIQDERRLEELKNKWWNHNPYIKNCYFYVKRNDGMELDNIVGIFYVLFGGVAITLISLIMEFIYFKSVPNKKKVITVTAFKGPSFAPSTSLN